MADPVSSPVNVLVVDDDDDVRKAAAMLLGRHGFVPLAARTPEEAWSVLADSTVDVILLDLNFSPGARSGSEGLRCLEGLIGHDPDAVVVVVTGHSGVNIAVAAMRAGAADFIMKPWHNDRLIAALREAADRRAARRRARAAGIEPPNAAGAAPPILGDSQGMREALALALRAAPTEAPVLLLGEAGRGKSLMAEFIHRHSGHASATLVTLDPGAAWSESEAVLAAGLAAAAQHRTLLLDEVAGLAGGLQRRLASWIATQAGVRLMATSRDGGAGLRAGLIGLDLLYRLNTVEIVLPPLRARGADVVLLARHFLRLAAIHHGRPQPELSAEACAAIAAAPWPGNLRDLRQAMERVVVLGTRVVVQPEDVLPPPSAAGTPIPGQGDLNLERSERAAVQAALRRHGFNVTHAARDLGLTRAALYRRMARHGL